MTYWYDRPDDTKGRWHWLRIALSFAYEIGLNRRSELIGLSPKQQQSRRRLWWCCFVKDKLIALNERRPSNIGCGDADIPVLEPKDFESHYFSEVLSRTGIPNPANQTDILNELFCQKIKLCILFGRVLDTQYESRGHRRFTSTDTKVLIFPRLSGSTTATVLARDQDLCQWTADFCSNFRGLGDPDSEGSTAIVRLHSAILELVYQCIRSMVHRPHILSSGLKDPSAGALQDLSKQILRDAARRTTEIASGLAADGLVEYLAPISITALLFAAMQHTSDRSASNPMIREKACEYLHQTMACLHRLREVYGSAHHAIALLEIVHGQGTVSPLSREASQRLFTRPTRSTRERTHSTITSKVSPQPKDSHDAGIARAKVAQPGTGTIEALAASPSQADSQNQSPGMEFDTEGLMGFSCPPETTVPQGFEFDSINWPDIIQDWDYDSATWS